MSNGPAHSIVCGSSDNVSNKTPPTLSSHSDGRVNKKPGAAVTFWKIFRSMNPPVRLKLTLSILLAVVHGTLLPITLLTFGSVIDRLSNLFLPLEHPEHLAPVDLLGAVDGRTRIFLIIGITAWVVSTIQLLLSLQAASEFAGDLRDAMYHSVLRQPPPFHEAHSPAALTEILMSDIALLEEATGEKLVTIVQNLTTFLAAIIIGFIKGWRLNAVLLAISPILILSGYAASVSSTRAVRNSQQTFQQCADIASQAFTMIRTVTAFSLQDGEVARYQQALNKVFDNMKQASIYTGLCIGLSNCLMFGIYALGFWYGGVEVDRENMKVGDVLIIFYLIVFAAGSLGLGAQGIKALVHASAAAPRIFSIIELQNDIDPMREESTDDVTREDNSSDDVIFNNVSFSYNSMQTVAKDNGVHLFSLSEENVAERKSSTSRTSREADDADQVRATFALEGISLRLRKDKSVAIVGPTGSGKSTITRLLQRVYDPSSGSICIGSTDIRDLNLRKLRSQIGTVSQTPSLFRMSIRDNIALGRRQKSHRSDSVKYCDDDSESDIIAAAKLANIHDFISNLPDGYDTVVGERGAMLSGGQKQRICIARSIVGNPSILILDESTASLDAESERHIQQALLQVSQGRMTVYIAHRLSTIRECDEIVYVEHGRIKERGTHDELMQVPGGSYRMLHNLQQQSGKQTLDNHGSNLGAMDSISDEHSGSQSSGYQQKIEQQQLARAKEMNDHDDAGNEDAGSRKERSVSLRRLFLRLLRTNRKQRKMLVLGSIGAIGFTASWPISTIIIVNLIELMAQPAVDMNAVRSWSLRFLYIALSLIIAFPLYVTSFDVYGEGMARELRTHMFRSLLKMEMAYFDKHQVGELTSLLSSEITQVKNSVGEFIGASVSIASVLLCGLIISFINSWRLTLILIAIVPGLTLQAFFDTYISVGIAKSTRDSMTLLHSMVSECLDNLATVRDLTRERHFYDKFVTLRQSINYKRFKTYAYIALAFGFSEFCLHFMWYATFKAGVRFIQNGWCTFQEVVQSSMAMLYAFVILGRVLVNIPKIFVSLAKSEEVFQTLDQRSEINPDLSESGDAADQEVSIMENLENWNVQVRDAHFTYPTRRDVPVLKNFNLNVQQNTTIALVGSSGNGKSTILELLQRFYNLDAGSIQIGDTNIRHPAPSDVRAQMSVVSQDTQLFNRTVFDNIAVGIPAGVPVTEEAVELAARRACAHDFIEQLPKGYETVVGERGELLSGGQRQRIVIARSMMRQPRLLIMDEPTSALDYYTEQEVMKQLESQAAHYPTTIILVSHRLSTIRKASCIFVVRDGSVVEYGSHDELFERKSAYFELVKSQLE